METTVIYDTYVDSNSSNINKNYGSLTDILMKINENHAILYWDLNHDDLTELKIRFKISELKIVIRKWKTSGFSESIYPNNLLVKIDLYSLAEETKEMEVTWNIMPKTELVKKDFITLGPNQNIAGQELTIDLAPYIDQIKNGIMLKINNFVENDFKAKYPTPGEGYTSIELYVVEVRLNSSESLNPPILIYNYGERPLSPTIRLPEWGSIVNKKETSLIRFEWDSVGQTNYIFEYSQDNSTWTKLEGTTAKFVNVTTSGLMGGSLYARVKIKSNNLWSDYSQTWFLQIGEKPNTPAVSLLGITTSTPIVSWNANPLQKMYQVQVLQDSTVIIDSGEVQGSINQYTLKSRLEDDKPYTFKVRISDENGIWSDWGIKTATINFIKPAMPTFSLYLNPDRGSVFIKIQNPTPETGEEQTIFNDIFRKEGNGEWLRIATNVISEFNDLTIKPKSEVYYKVRAIGQNGYVDSTIKGTEFIMRYSDLSVVGEWGKHVKLKYNDKKQQNTGYTGSLLIFAGRNKPVVEFDDSRNNDIALEFEITNKKDLDMLQDIIDSRKTLLYRDSRGRKLYGSVISKLNIQDSEFNYYTVGFTFTETDFNEVV